MDLEKKKNKKRKKRKIKPNKMDFFYEAETQQKWITALPKILIKLSART